MRSLSRWNAMPASRRAALLGALGAVLALLLSRPDLAALTAPLLVLTLWERAASRILPGTPEITVERASDSAAEDDLVHATFRVSGQPPGTLLLSQHASRPWLRSSPADRDRVVVGAAADRTYRVSGAAERWGRYTWCVEQAMCTSRWGAYAREVTGSSEADLVVVPRPRPIRLSGVLHATVGGPGAHPGRRPGPGFDLAGLRAYVEGDELRRVHWPTSLRFGELMVVETSRDTEIEYLMLLDVPDDEDAELVRQVAGVARTLLSRGDRVGLALLNADDQIGLTPRNGRGQLVRVSRVLATATPRPGAVRNDFQPARIARMPLRPGTIVLAFSTLTSADTVHLLMRLHRRGHRVAVAHSKARPTGTPKGTAERIADAEGAVHGLRLASVGIPVSVWTVASSDLSALLRRLHRRHPAGTWR